MNMASVKKVQNHMDGQWVDSTGTEIEAVPNPATGEVIAFVALSTTADVDRAVEVALHHLISR